MSDSDSYEMNEDEEEYDFEYSDDDASNTSDIDSENSYYNAKGSRDDSLSSGIAAFLAVIKTEESGEKTVWGFKSLKQLIKCYYKQEDFKEMVEIYKKLLGYISCSAVTQNISEKGINSILDRLSNEKKNQDLLHSIYNETLAFFSSGDTKNERLWFKCSLKLGQLLLDVDDNVRFQKVINTLLEKSEDGSQGTSHMMEIYALQIQMYGKTRDTKKLKDLYAKALSVQNNVPHPRTLGIIHDCGGKTYMQAQQWKEAKDAFFISFKSFDEAGDHSRLRVLRYLLLASMLHESAINPLDSPEARPYKDAAEIQVMTRLVSAFHGNRIKEFETILKRNEGGVMDDKFIRGYLEELRMSVRKKVAIKIIEGFERVSFGWLSGELCDISEEEVERLLVVLILEGRISGQIDQVKKYLTITPPTPPPTTLLMNSITTLSISLQSALATANDSIPGKAKGGGFQQNVGFGIGGIIGEKGWRGRKNLGGKGADNMVM
ncbi:hypothetical protein TrVE_jg6092 [Triparma verrucosa]|uniref:PCI domain-containing protein n=1 Tax=Triparma verrucosa TaxID=1606542 RepID=A0A9W7BZP9_9STRA|nr:hypothetical protein TrVE_jg6092 [Triparma verrucosa]